MKPQPNKVLVSTENLEATKACPLAVVSVVGMTKRLNEKWGSAEKRSPIS